MNIKERLTQEIETAKKRHFTRDILFNLELSKTRPNHFQNLINDIKDEMGKYQISRSWIEDGCNDIMRTIWREYIADENDEAICTEEFSWIERIIEANLKDTPEDKVWQEVQWFLIQYFYILKCKEYIKIKTSKKQPRKINPDLKLADVLLDGIPVAEVKKLFKYHRCTNYYIGKFLRYLIDLGYFKRSIHELEIEILGRNEFKPSYKDRRGYNVKNLNVNDFRFRDIPDPKSFIKS